MPRFRVTVKHTFVYEISSVVDAADAADADEQVQNKMHGRPEERAEIEARMRQESKRAEVKVHVEELESHQA